MSPSLVFDLIRTTDKNGSACESLSSIWAEQNHYQDWLNMHPGCECLSSVWADQNHWQEWLIMHSFGEFFSSVWADKNSWMHLVCEFLSSIWMEQNHWQNGWTHIQFVSPSLVFEPITTDKNGWKSIQGVSPSSVFEQIRTWQEWLNTYQACESLSGVWADQNHWQEWLNTSSKWVPLLCWSRSKPLTRMAEYASRMWVSI